MRFFSDNAAAAHPKVHRGDRRLEPASTPPMTATNGASGSTAPFRTCSGLEVRALLGQHRDRRQLPRAGGAVPALSRHPLPQGRAYRGRRGRRAGLFHRRRQADAARRTRREGRAGDGRRGLRPRSARTSTRSSRRRSRSPTRPNTASSIVPPRSPRWARWRSSAGSRFHMDGARLANAAGRHRRQPCRPDLARRRRRLVVRLHQERRAQRRVPDPVQDRAGRRDRGPPQARGTSVVEGPNARGANPRPARRRICGSTMPRAANAAAQSACQGRAGTAGSIRSRRTSCSSGSTPTRRRGSTRAGVRFLRWGPGEIRLVTSWDQRGEAVDRLASAIAACDGVA